MAKTLQKKNTGSQIFIIIICIAIYMALFGLQGYLGNHKLTSYSGLVSQAQVMISIILVLTAYKKGFITSICLNLFNSIFIALHVIKLFGEAKSAQNDLDGVNEKMADLQGQLGTVTGQLQAAQAEGAADKVAGLQDKITQLQAQVGGLGTKIGELTEKHESALGTARGQLPGTLVALCTIIIITIIYVYLTRTKKMHKELTASYENLIETNRIIQEKDEKLTFLAYYDVLTGMPNRQLFIDKLEDNINKQTPCSVIYIDIDDFKKINDIYGHNVGDAMLMEYADRFKKFCGEVNFVGRIGGDEFGIILNGNLTESAIIEYIDKIRRLITEPVDVNGALFRVTMSYGIASYPQDGRTSVEIFRCTDIAVFNAKANGKDRPCFFSQQSQYMR